VAGGGDGEEFREALDDAEQQRGDEGGLVQEEEKKEGREIPALEL
jgi:hypothetical protein